MKIEDILPALREGKRARRPDWPKGLTVTFDRKTGLVDSEGDELEINLAYLHADDWELVPEKRKFSRKIYLWDDGEVTTIRTRYYFLHGSHHLLPETNILETRTIEWEASE